MGEAITMKEAVAKAKAHLTELYTNDELPVLALEEIEKDTRDGKNVWAVTFGFFRQRNVSMTKPAGVHIMDYIKPPVAEIENRVYKTVFIDADTGEFLKMNMRQVS